MSERDSAYHHSAEIPGSADEKSPPPSKEHKDTAYGNAEQRNELTPDQRGRPEGLGPRTHDDTKIVRKGDPDRS